MMTILEFLRLMEFNEVVRVFSHINDEHLFTGTKEEILNNPHYAGVLNRTIKSFFTSDERILIDVL